MAAFTKLFSSIITSTVWLEDDQTRIVWITMLALADKDGEVAGSVPGLARLAGVSVEACDVALAKLTSPDGRSRTKTDEGRRIEEIDGGWSIINHGKYRKMASKEEQIEKATARTRRYRDRRARNALSTPVHDIPTEAEAEAEADTVKKDHSTPKRAERGTRLPDDWVLTPELRAFASDLGLDPDGSREEFVDYWTAVPGTKGLKLDWSKTFKNRCRELAKKPRGGRFSDKQSGHVPRDDNWAWKVTKWREDKFWPSTWGPSPDEPGCFVPKEFLQ